MVGYRDVWDPTIAVDVQSVYCDANSRPIFAPRSGICPWCCTNIFMPKYGFTLFDAATRHITGCPFCHHTFCD